MISQTCPHILRTHYIFMKEVDSDWTDFMGHVIAYRMLNFFRTMMFDWICNISPFHYNMH